MRRTVLSGAALACAALVATTAPAFAAGSAATPRPVAATRSARPTPEPAPVRRSAAPSPVPGARRRAAVPTTAPRPVPTAVSGRVAVVPKGAPDTGVPPLAARGGGEGVATGTAVGAAALLGAAGVVVLRRRSKA